ncbi:MAG: PaaI family thioesterase [Erythrobacter sp.]
MTSSPYKPVLTAQQLADFFVEAFPGQNSGAVQFLRVDPGVVELRQTPDETMLRPGGIVSGPTQMAIADRAAYAVILAHIGIVPMAVTSNLNMSFLRALPAKPFFAGAQLIKLGRRLATVDVRIWSDDPAILAAQSTVTYAIPAET